MTVITTVAAPPVLVQLFKGNAPGLRRPSAETVEETLRFSFPGHELAEWVFSRLTTVFENEGFFVHTLEHDHDLVQVRRDTAVVNMWPAGTDIVFACDAGDAALARTAVYEVIGELRGVLEGLQSPIDVASVVGDLQAPAATDAGSTSSLLLSTLAERVVVPRLQADSKEEVIAELLDCLCEEELILDRDVAWRDLIDRERSMSTGLQRGVAIPHARTRAVNRLVCALGLKPAGLDFDALDGEPSRVFVLTLSPADAPAPHVQLMSEISQLLSPERCARLLAAKSAREVLAVLRMPAGELEKRTLSPAAPAPAPAPVPQPAAAPGTTGGRFRLADYIDDDLIVPRLQADSKPDAIRELAGVLCKARNVEDQDAVIKALLEREELMSTGLENGIAVPHCRLPVVSDLVCAVGFAPNGIPFDSADGNPARILVLTVVPPSSSAPYVQFMASLLQAIDAAGVDALLRLPDNVAIRDRLLSENSSGRQ
jgi:mannitol/fructose-specific phosphotransferase system IIA component (Ntr-type)